MPLAASLAFTLALNLLLPWVAAAAADAPVRTIFTCVDGKGKRLTSDRLIPECVGREQNILNHDGSVKRVVPPTLTSEEMALAEAREREVAAERVARQDAIRRDRLLLGRYPNEAAHAKAREAALDDIRSSVASSEARVKRLSAERKPLLDEAEFYVSRPMPQKLREQLDGNDAALSAQLTLIQNQQVEVLRINDLFNSELVRLRKLWAGAAPGSLGPASAPQTAAATHK
jgi:hypothetical protein